MPTPITWRNVNAPDFTEASAILDRAGNSVNTGLDTLRGMLNDSQARDARNQATTKRNNSQAFLDQLGKLSPQELDQARADGTLQKLRDSLGPMDWNSTNSAAVDNLLRGKWGFQSEQATQALKDYAQTFARQADPTQETATQMRERFLAGAPGNVDPLQLQATWDTLGQSLSGRQQVAPGDQGKVDRWMTNLADNFQMGSNPYLQAESQDPKAVVSQMVKDNSVEEDGHKILLGIRDQSNRGELESQLLELSTVGLKNPDTGQYHQVPPLILDRILNSLTDVGYVWNGQDDFKERVRKEMSKDYVQELQARYNAYKNYAGHMQANAADYLRNGGLPPTPTLEDMHAALKAEEARLKQSVYDFNTGTPNWMQDYSPAPLSTGGNSRHGLIQRDTNAPLPDFTKELLRK